MGIDRELMTDANRRWYVFFAALLAVSVVAPAPAVAISATANSTPAGAQVGENVSATFTLTELSTEAPRSWQLHATTELDSASWTVTAYGPNGSERATRSFDSESVSVPVRATQNISKIKFAVSGTVPMISNFTYKPKERFVLASFSRGQGPTPTLIETWSVHHYTPASHAARQKINATQVAIGDGGSNDELEEQVKFAIAAYRNGSFELAIAIAEDAQDTAEEEHYPVALLSGLVLGGIIMALGSAGLRSYRARNRENDPWQNR